MSLYLGYLVSNYRFRRKQLHASRREAFSEAQQARAFFRKEAKRLPQTDQYNEHCVATIGPSGACLGSISGYKAAHPRHVVGKNQVLVKNGKMFWYGDIDYTQSYSDLMALAERIGPFEIYHESWSHGSDYRKGMKPDRVIYPYD